MMFRTFYPIGQGAFYSERHEGFNIVYDCGNWKNTKMADRVVRQSFESDEVIDILFISHFDFDHVSKISTLRDHVKEIKRVVMPLLHDNEKILLSNIYNALNINISGLITNPGEYFRPETRIILIRPTENPEGSFSDNNDPQDIDNLPFGDDRRSTEIEGGRALSIKGYRDWVFIPFNFEFKERRQKLIELLGVYFDTNKLMNDNKYTLDKIIEDTKLTRKRGGKKLQDIYDKLHGSINQNSMILYSGPLKGNSGLKFCFRDHCCKHHYHCHFPYCCDAVREKVGCVYTGDSDLNVIDLNIVFRRLMQHVGTIQVPHHGAISSFHKDSIIEDCCYPISFGSTNTYRHPSPKVISDILKKGGCPIFVTEKTDSVFIEDIM